MYFTTYQLFGVKAPPPAFIARCELVRGARPGEPVQIGISLDLQLVSDPALVEVVVKQFALAATTPYIYRKKEI